MHGTVTSVQTGRIAMLLYGEITHDARVIREASTLTECGNTVVVYSLASDRPPLDLPFEVRAFSPGRGVVPGAPSPFRTGRPTALGRMIARIVWVLSYGLAFAGWVRAVGRASTPADVWHGHDLFGLVAASWLGRRHGGVVVYDSHELFLEAGSAARLPGALRRGLGWVEGWLARRAVAVITVNASIATELEKRYRVRPTVVMNCPPLPEMELARRLRAEVRPRPKRLVMYHGALNPGRGVEQLVLALPEIDQGAGVVLLGDGDLMQECVDLAATPPFADRLYVHAAVPVQELPAWIAEADIGVIAFQPIDLNNEFGTPNKLFEYLSVGVPVVVSDFPEMARIVREADVGETCDPTRPESIAAAVNRLLSETDADRLARRARARALAESRFNWAVESRALLGVYGSITFGAAEGPDHPGRPQ
jgi:glycosyltransferase involved in cell wall biosynthesis